MEIIETVIGIVEKYFDLIQAIGITILAIATTVLAIATIGLCCGTIKMARSSKLMIKENKILHEESKKPQVLMKLQVQPDHGITVNVIISNVGRGAALNVKFRLDGNNEDMKRREVMTKGNQKPINYLSSGESEIYLLGTNMQLFKDPPMNPLTAIIQFEDIDGQSYESHIILDVTQFKDVTWETSSVAWRGMRALEKIEHTLEQVNRHLSKLLR